ncbi:MAG: hypothetical protein EZS28_054887, partial [Streblomastix strix]
RFYSVSIVVLIKSSSSQFVFASSVNNYLSVNVFPSALIRNPRLFVAASDPKQIVKPNGFYAELVGVVIIFYQPAVTPPSVAGLKPKYIPAPYDYRIILKPALLSFKLLLICTTELKQFPINAVLLDAPLGSQDYISLIRTSLNGIVSKLQFVY